MRIFPMRYILIPLILFLSACGGVITHYVPKNAVVFISEGMAEIKLQVPTGTAIGSRRFPSRPVRQGYGFAGWSFTADGTKAEFFPDSVVTEELTLYAIWMKEIFSASELEAINDNLDASYILTDNITLFDWAWTPIGTDEQPFTGILDGAGYTVHNMVAQADAPAGGLFGTVESAEIRNLHIESALIEMQGKAAPAGIIAAYANDTVIDRCTVSGMVITGSAGGGIIGILHGGSIRRSSVTVEVSAFSAGGLVGRATDALIALNQVSGFIQAEDTGGGFLGAAENSRLTESYSTADVAAGRAAGGIVGSLNNSIISAVYTAGSVSASSDGGYAGGIAGEGTEGSTVERSLSVSAEISGTYAARISPSKLSFSNNYAYSLTAMPHEAFSDINGADGENTRLRVNRNFFTGADGVNKLNWDFENVWRLPDNKRRALPVFIRGIQGGI